jgi:ribonuclease BN (tRNA processing enzyme)
MTPASQDWLHASFGFLADCLFVQPVDVGWQFELDGVRYTGLEVTHAPGTLGLLMETAGGQRTVYIPDTGPLPTATLEQIHGVDTLILGATFWGRNWMPADHLSVEEAVQIALQARPGRLFLTHLSMHHDIPVTNRELESYLGSFDRNFYLAYDGTCIEV